MKTIIIEANQSLRDIALQHYGTLEAVGEILTLNSSVLANDPEALLAAGVDIVNDSAFYLDVALEVGLKLTVDPTSRIAKRNIVLELTTPQSKYTL